MSSLTLGELEPYCCDGFSVAGSQPFGYCSPLDSVKQRRRQTRYQTFLRDNLGAPPKITGVMDDEAGDSMLGNQVQTTKPGTTVLSKPHVVPLQRRLDLTRAVEELEFLVRDPSVSADALLSKLRSARRALVGSASWPFAQYAGVSENQSFDAHEYLVARLDEVQRVLEWRLGYQLTGRAAV